MTDVVERLRNVATVEWFEPLAMEAADEIERLRKALSFFFEMNDNEVGLKYTHIEAQRLAVAELTREKSDD